MMGQTTMVRILKNWMEIRRSRGSNETILDRYHSPCLVVDLSSWVFTKNAWLSTTSIGN